MFRYSINTRSICTVIAIVGTLFITWIPVIVLLITQVQQNEPYTYHNFLVSTLMEALLLLNTWLNVIIYYLRNRELRQALNSVLSDWRRYLFQRSLP